MYSLLPPDGDVESNMAAPDLKGLELEGYPYGVIPGLTPEASYYKYEN
jgi:hypothetical protein